MSIDDVRTVLEALNGPVFDDLRQARVAKAYEALDRLAREGLDVEPVAMVLHCPRCGTQHIDAPEPKTGWTNPPHKSHLCHSCKTIWRPATIPTAGVAKLEVTGDLDTWAPGSSCDICNDTGQIAVGTSGLEYDGNAVITERCPECGYASFEPHQPAAVPQWQPTVDEMVNRFLGWKLPADFSPDAGISFKATYNENISYCAPCKHEPVGTNLLRADQARAMIEYLLAPPSSPTQEPST